MPGWEVVGIHSASHTVTGAGKAVSEPQGSWLARKYRRLTSIYEVKLL